MSDKTTTLKTQTGDNVYPDIKGENRKDSFANSSTIKHYYYAETHKVGFQLANETSNKIANSLQKPAGLTKTELVGVGTNGQENIEIGDNLTLENGKLSVSGGGGGEAFDVITFSTDGETYTGNISGTKPILVKQNNSTILYETYIDNDGTTDIFGIAYILGHFFAIDYTLKNGKIESKGNVLQNLLVNHFLTLTNSGDNIALYLTIQSAQEDEYTADTLASYLAGKKVLVNGNLRGVVPTYIAGEGGSIKVYYMTPGDSNINPDPDVYSDLSSFAISDLISPVE